MKKIISIVFGIVCLTLCLGIFAACTPDDGDGGGGGIKTYVMEAEYINLDGLAGAGLSSEASGVDMIYGSGSDTDKAKDWSGGYYVGYTYSSGLIFNFVFNSDAAATATVIVRLGSEIGDISLSPNSFAVKVNGAAVSYGSMFIENSEDMANMKFTDKTVTTSASLKKGENIISLEVLNNTILSNRTGGPMIDCIKIKTSAVLTWTDKTDNPDRKGEI